MREDTRPASEILLELARRVSEGVAERADEAEPPHGEPPEAILSLVDEVLARPGAEEELDLDEILAELAESCSRAGRAEEALAILDRAIAAGWDPVPDAQMDRARFLMRAGRLEEARAIHRSVAEASPDEVWTHNAAGLDEARHGSAVRAVHWFGLGIERTLEQGDDRGVLQQLLEERAASLAEAGLEPDALQPRGTTFLETEVSPSGPLALDPWVPHSARRGAVPAVGWFGGEEHARALERWPTLAERWGTADHAAYTSRLGQRLPELERAMGRRLSLVRMTVADLVAFAEELGVEAGHSIVRRRWVAEAHGKGAGSDWPPGRNDTCWCGSGTKYKRCCGRRGQAPAPPGEAAEKLVSYELDVTLTGVSPPIWRRLEIPCDATFRGLHDAIQIASGWSSEHMYDFRDRSGRAIAGPRGASRLRSAPPSAEEVPLGSYFCEHDRCVYVYDFGDDWRHEIELRRRVRPTSSKIRFLDGARAFPPEDCGGLGRYLAIVAGLADGTLPPEEREWLGGWDPEAFDIEALRRAARD